MAIGATNVKFSDIQTEYGGSNPISLTEYYRSGAYVPNGPVPGSSVASGGITAATSAGTGTGNIPTSGQISVSSIRSSSKIVTVTVTIAAGTYTNLDLWSLITARLGTINNPVNCTCTVSTGVVIHSTSVATPALTTGSGWPASSTLNIVNNGYIIGKGGAGGTGGGTAGLNGTQGGAGGPALNLTLATTIDNLNGYIWAGGGGGGGGGCGIWFNFSQTQYAAGGGGGGGQSYSDSSGGSVGTSYDLGGAYGYTTLVTGSNGNSGTNSGGGTGGVGRSTQYSSGKDTTVTTGGTGGTGGGYGAAGLTGGTATAAIPTGPTAYGGSSGGAVGYYVIKNSNSLTWTNTGSRLGTEQT
jgi:hypothetical protein